MIEVVVEIPRGSRNKYEFDRAAGVFRLDRVLSSAVFYNFDYGFVEGTLSGDGDPTDALLLIDEPTFPGCHVWARPVGGLLISEFPMGSTAFPQNFPIRNRIISGMCHGVLVVEGAQYSGSSITAKLAMDQGREVFAVPGNITSKASWGPNLLIKQGAKLVQDWNDVVVDLPVEVRRSRVCGLRARSSLKRISPRLLRFSNKRQPWPRGMS